MARIVIADDSPTLRRIVSSPCWTRPGTRSSRPRTASARCSRSSPCQPDAVVLDVQMPRVSGFIAARVLKDDWSTADIPVVMLTSLDAASDRYWAGQAGVDRYLTKDFEAPELAGTIDEVLLAASALARRTAAAGERPRRADRGGRPVARLRPARPQALRVLRRLLGHRRSPPRRHGLEATVAALLGVAQRFVGYDLAAVVLAEEAAAYVAVGRPTAQSHYADFVVGGDRVAAVLRGRARAPEALSARVAQAGGTLVEDPDDLPGGAESAPMSTFLSMPLRGHGGAVVGVLALSSAAKNAFGETALSHAQDRGGPGGDRHRQRPPGRAGRRRDLRAGT